MSEKEEGPGNRAPFAMYKTNFPLYDEKGYINIPGIINFDPVNLCWIFLILGRGTGKTFTAIKEGVRRADAGLGSFIYMRRTQDQCDLISKPEFCPINAINEQAGGDLKIEPITKKNSGIFHSEINKDGNLVSKGPVLGITAGLSTFRNLRGLSLERCSLLVYDEFVPEPTERPLRNEGLALEHAYETVNRNRELAGRDPLICLCMGNADDLANPVFQHFAWSDRAEWMVKNDREYYFDYGRRTAIYIPHDSPISLAKAGTALYAMSGHSKFSDMAINNRFSQEGIPGIVTRPLREYNPLVSLPSFCVYRHKDRAVYYVSSHRSGSPEEFSDLEMDMARFRRKYIYLWEAYMRENIEFESYSLMRHFEASFNG